MYNILTVVIPHRLKAHLCLYGRIPVLESDIFEMRKGISEVILFADVDNMDSNFLLVYSHKADSNWSSCKIVSTLEEIDLRTSVIRHSLMP